MAPFFFTPNERKTVTRNFFSLFSLQGMTYLIPVLIIPYLIRVIGPDKFGLIAFAQAFVQYFMILTDYGFSVSATREIALCRSDQNKECSIFWSVFLAKFFLSLLSLAIFLAVVALVPRFKRDWLVYAFSFGPVIGNSLFPVWYFQGKEKMTYIAKINIVGGILFAVALLCFVHAPRDYLYVPLLTSLFSLGTGIAGFFTAFNRFDLEFIRPTTRGVTRELKAGWNIFISSVAINAYTSSRVFAVGLLTNNVLTGYYAVAERIAGVFQSFPLDSLSQAIYPRLNKIYVCNKTRAVYFMRRIQRSTTLVFLVVIPFALMLSAGIVRLVCGRGYPVAIDSLQLLLFAVFGVGYNAFRVQFLLIAGRSDLYARLHIIAAVIGLPLIFLCIGYFSYLGAAIATILIETGVIFATSYVLTKIV